MFRSVSCFSEITMPESTVWAQCDNVSNLIVLHADFGIKHLFSSYGMTCSPQTLLWHVLDDPSA